MDDGGTILSIDTMEDHDPASVNNLSGVLIPGYVNAHCHLELSHMKGKIDSGTGLIKFIRNIVAFREAGQEEILDAIARADQEMSKNGIVAVGDICNKADSFAQKEMSQILYYSFVEMFDFMQPHLAEKFYTDYKLIYDQVIENEGHKCSAVPHAPYSVSDQLYDAINQLNETPGSVSIHNQETIAESTLFRDKSGDLVTLFSELGFPYGAPLPTGESSLKFALDHLDPKHRLLLVHNTQSTRDDIDTAHQWSDQIYWVSCPNANLYIENTLPDYEQFAAGDAKVCLGTDSLSSNWQLSIFEEMKTIKKYCSGVCTSDLIKWATLHGAQSLGIEDRYGTIEVGKRPGLNLVSTNELGELDNHSTSQRIA